MSIKLPFPIQKAFTWSCRHAPTECTTVALTRPQQEWETLPQERHAVRSIKLQVCCAPVEAWIQLSGPVTEELKHFEPAAKKNYNVLQEM